MVRIDEKLGQDCRMKGMHRVPCFFQSKGFIAFCYAENLLVFAKSKEKIDQLRSKLSGDLIARALGTTRLILWIELICQKDAVYLRQKGMQQKLPEYNKMEKTKLRTLRMSASLKPTKLDKHAVYEKYATSYRIIVISLFYIGIEVRPDLCGVASCLSAHLERPCQVHLVFEKRKLNYFKGFQIVRWGWKPNLESMEDVCTLKLGIYTRINSENSHWTFCPILKLAHKPCL